jgi:hypothetical protein
MQTADGGGESPPDKKDVFVHSPTPALLVMAECYTVGTFKGVGLAPTLHLLNGSYRSYHYCNICVNWKLY